jgi:hypothetical protein
VIKLAKAKKKVVMHKLVKGFNGITECSITSDNTKPTWRGVTCKRCLKVKEAQDAAKKKKKKER